MVSFPSDSPFYEQHEQLQLFPTEKVVASAPGSDFSSKVVAEIIQQALDVLDLDGNPIEAIQLLREALTYLD